MTEQAQQDEGAHARILREMAQLAEIKQRFRQIVARYIRERRYNPDDGQVRGLLDALRIPQLHVPDEEAAQQIRQETAWQGDPGDYTEAGLRKQLQNAQTTVRDWCTGLREQLSRLQRDGIITREQEHRICEEAGVPARAAESRIVVQFTITGSASAAAADVNGYSDEAVREGARAALSRLMREVREQNGFRMDGSTRIEVQVSRS